METAAMGKVLVKAKLENLFDVENRECGLIAPEKDRAVEVEEALIDAGATGLLVPKKIRRSSGIAGVSHTPKSHDCG